METIGLIFSGVEEDQGKQTIHLAERKILKPKVGFRPLGKKGQLLKVHKVNTYLCGHDISQEHFPMEADFPDLEGWMYPSKPFSDSICDKCWEIYSTKYPLKKG